MTMLNTFTSFLEDENADDMFITGHAGTGKTTALNELITYCQNEGIEYVCCAHTHKACGVLRNKLPENALICTLHKFLRKIPAINQDASHIKHLNTNYQIDIPERPRIVFVDEFSMVGEADLTDVRAIQDPEDEDEEDAYNVKLVWIGDLNQLPPVQDMQTLDPGGKYWVKLTKQYRQAADNPLNKPLLQLVEFIEGRRKPEPLVESDNFIRGVDDLADLYMDCLTDKVLLCYTNAQVQHYNFMIQGRNEPEPGDILFCPSNHQTYELLRIIPRYEIQYVDQHSGQLELNTKFKSLEYLIQSNFCDFYHVSDEDGEEFIYPAVFGTSNFNDLVKRAGQEATKANKAIEHKHKPESVAQWAKANWQDELARNRSKAWRLLLALRKNTFCLDFNHAMTVHKSQGSTYTTVFVDTQDLGICANTNYNLYLRLMYVALSRASNTVVTN